MPENEHFSTTEQTDRKQRKNGREKGQAILEFALILPLFLILIMGVVDFGLALKSYITVTNASREGARYAVICPSNDTVIKTRVADYSDGLLTADNVSLSWEGGTRCTSEKYVEVTTTYDHYFITPLAGVLNMFGSVVPDHVQLIADTKMRQE
jgi:hypothetical protein